MAAPGSEARFKEVYLVCLMYRACSVERNPINQIDRIPATHRGVRAAVSLIGAPGFEESPDGQKGDSRHQVW